MVYLDFALLDYLKLCYSKLDFALQHSSKLCFDNKLDFALQHPSKLRFDNKLDFATQHPSKLRFDNTKNEKKRSSELGVFFLILVFIRDLDWIQTSNLLSRNQVRYSVAPRGLFCGCKYSQYYQISK